jgi:hypothetical protein
VESICPDTWWGSYPRSIDVTQKREGEKCNDAYRYYTLTNQKRVRVDENSVARYKIDPQATLANDVDLRQQIKPVHPKNCAEYSIYKEKGAQPGGSRSYMGESTTLTQANFLPISP